MELAPFRKDCGWSWVILAASFFTQITIFGLLLCFGIYFVTLLDYFDCTKRQVAVVGSIAYGTKCLTGLLSSVLYRKLGCRVVVMSGGIIAASGCFLSYFATELRHLYVTYGLLNGFGMGLAYTPTLGILPDYFDRYRYFATAFATVGSAAGTFLFQPIFLRTIEAFTWQGSMMINAGFALQIVVCGSLMRSRTVDRHLKWGSVIETSLYGEAQFWLLLVECVMWGGAIYVVFSMFNSLAMGRGVGRAESTLLVSVIGLCNVTGRLVSSLVGHARSTDRPLFYALVTALLSVGALLAARCASFEAFVVAAALFGLGFGAMLSQLPGVLMDLFGVRRFVNALGYSMFAVGIGGIALPIFAGWVADAYDVAASFYLASAVGLTATAFCFLIFALKRRSDLRAAQTTGTLMQPLGDETEKVACTTQSTSAGNYR